MSHLRVHAEIHRHILIHGDPFRTKLTHKDTDTHIEGIEGTQTYNNSPNSTRGTPEPFRWKKNGPQTITYTQIQNIHHVDHPQTPSSKRWIPNCMRAIPTTHGTHPDTHIHAQRRTRTNSIEHSEILIPERARVKNTQCHALS